ncbi:MAG: hypothetical protein ACOYXM_06110 [Actinomycetota bacterium]
MAMFLLPMIVFLGVLCYLPIWHWTTRDAAYFDRIGVAHPTWKTAFTIGFFGPMPVVGLAWWAFAIRDALRASSGSATTEKLGAGDP